MDAIVLEREGEVKGRSWSTGHAGSVPAEGGPLYAGQPVQVRLGGGRLGQHPLRQQHGTGGLHAQLLSCRDVQVPVPSLQRHASGESQIPTPTMESSVEVMGNQQAGTTVHFSTSLSFCLLLHLEASGSMCRARGTLGYVQSAVWAAGTSLVLSLSPSPLSLSLSLPPSPSLPPTHFASKDSQEAS